MPETSNLGRGDFEVFPLLPLELREEVWRMAFIPEPWSVIKLDRAAHCGHVSNINRVPCPAAGHSCREARRVMKRCLKPIPFVWFSSPTHRRAPKMTHFRKIEPKAHNTTSAWLDTERVLFFYYDRREFIDTSIEILQHIRHIIVQATGWRRVLSSLKIISSTRRELPPLRSITLIAPFSDESHLDPIPNTYWRDMDWGQIFYESPAELDWAPLIEDIEKGGSTHTFENIKPGQLTEKLIHDMLGFAEPRPRLYLRRSAVFERLLPIPDGHIFDDL